MFGVMVVMWIGQVLTFSELVWKRNKYVPGLGSFHGSDLQEFYDFTGLTDWVGADAVSTCLYVSCVVLDVIRRFLSLFFLCP